MHASLANDLTDTNCPSWYAGMAGFDAACGLGTEGADSLEQLEEQLKHSWMQSVLQKAVENEVCGPGNQN